MKLKIVFIDFKKLKRHRSENKKFIDHYGQEYKTLRNFHRCFKNRVRSSHYTVGIEGKGSQLALCTPNVKLFNVRLHMQFARSCFSFCFSLHVFSFLFLLSAHESNDNNSFSNHDERVRNMRIKLHAAKVVVNRSSTNFRAK